MGRGLASARIFLKSRRGIRIPTHNVILHVLLASQPGIILYGKRPDAETIPICMDYGYTILF